MTKTYKWNTEMNRRIFLMGIISPLLLFPPSCYYSLLHTVYTKEPCIFVCLIDWKIRSVGWFLAFKIYFNIKEMPV